MAKFAGRSVVLKRGDGATPTEAFTTIGQVSAIGDFGDARDQIDVSTYGDDWKDFLGGQREGSDFEVTVLFDDADTSHTALKADSDGSLSRNFRVESAAMGYGWTISTRVLGFMMGTPIDGAVQATVSTKIINPGVVPAAL